MGFLFLIPYPALPAAPPPQLCHTPSFTHNFVTHLFVTHHLSHSQLCHTPSFTYNFAIFHTQLCHTQLCHPQLSHTPSFTHNFVTHLFVTHHLSHSQLCHTPSFTYNFAIFHTQLGHRGALRGRRGTYGTGLAPVARLGAAWAPLVASDAAALCVAGVALGDIHLRLAWQAWHLVTSTFVLCGRRGTYGTGLAPVVHLGAAWAPLGPLGRRLGAAGRWWSPVTPRHFAWQAWHLATSTLILRGRCGTSRHPPSFCVAGVALPALGWLRWCTWVPMPLGRRLGAAGRWCFRFAWQA